MFPAILYFLAAGAAGVGGPAAAVVLFRQGQQEAAAHAQAADVESVSRLLRSRIDMSALREQAIAAGVDPDLVEEGYRKTRVGLVTVDQAMTSLRSLAGG